MWTDSIPTTPTLMLGKGNGLWLAIELDIGQVDLASKIPLAFEGVDRQFTGTDRFGDRRPSKELHQGLGGCGVLRRSILGGVMQGIRHGLYPPHRVPRRSASPSDHVHHALIVYPRAR